MKTFSFTNLNFNDVLFYHFTHFLSSKYYNQQNIKYRLFTDDEVVAAGQ